MKLTLSLSTLLLLVPSAACVSTPGAKPHDMSAANHEAMANQQAEEAAGHAAQYNPNATAPVPRCSSTARTEGSPCWASDNPTREHLDEAERHQKMAADHRAASQALRDAEARACVGISDKDRDMSPFAHREDIASVEPLTENVASGKNQYTKTVGATVTFRAVPEMTAQWLQRVVDCHMARSASLGHDVPEMAYCPLVPKNVSATVQATRTGFAVMIRSDDAATAQEILRRAQGLARR